MFSVNASMLATCPTPKVLGISASGRARTTEFQLKTLWTRPARILTSLKCTDDEPAALVPRDHNCLFIAGVRKSLAEP
jgi:hypothetical protein